MWGCEWYQPMTRVVVPVAAVAASALCDAVASCSGVVSTWARATRVRRECAARAGTRLPRASGTHAVAATVAARLWRCAPHAAQQLALRPIRRVACGVQTHSAPRTPRAPAGCWVREPARTAQEAHHLLVLRGERVRHHAQVRILRDVHTRKHGGRADWKGSAHTMRGSPACAASCTRSAARRLAWRALACGTPAAGCGTAVPGVRKLLRGLDSGTLPWKRLHCLCMRGERQQCYDEVRGAARSRVQPCVAHSRPEPR